MKKHFLHSAFHFFFVHFVAAQIGGFDPSFGDSGKIEIYLHSFSSNATKIVVLPDQKFLVGGSGYDENFSTDYCIARFKPDGAIDSTFHLDGMVQLDDNGIDVLRDLAVLADGKIIGLGFDNLVGFVLFKLTAQGYIDFTFGNGGFVRGGGGATYASPESMVILPDGKILVCGYAQIASSNVIVVARYLPNGLIDQTFGINGFIKKSIDGYSGRLHDVALQDDGKIIAAGQVIIGSSSADYHYLLQRYLPDGTSDSTFGTYGTVTGKYWPNATYSTVKEVQVLPDGKILQMGYAEYPFSTNLARFHSNGSLDSTFGTNGIQKIANVNNLGFLGRSFKVDSSGKIVIGGSVKSAQSSDNYFALRRLHENGILDIAFGNNGILDVNLIQSPSESELVASLDLQADGKIITAGVISRKTLITRHLVATALHEDIINQDFEEIGIYPNPIVESAWLHLILRNSTDLSIRMYDLNGRLVGREILHTPLSAGSHTIFLESLKNMPAGTYLVSIQSKSGKKQLWVIKR